ncbi:pyridoxal phosphate-dependent decarboxylase family protein [Caulobacter sp. KR2-114]|uniref:pyridoxal phosphate-dependent decarboxylase family protein n=1 Tax=Caulobacter sp. KR2-114 TaxID=3400912 RepID=UPI003BFF6FEF
MDDFEAALGRAREHALAFLGGLDDRPVAATVTAAELRQRLGGPLPERGEPPAQVVDALVAATEGGHLGSAGRRFFGWVIGSPLPAALGADWLVSTWDNNAAIHASSPAGSVAEEVAGDWIKQILDLPRDASFAFTTGCQMAHFTGLAAARNAVLAARGWDVETRGLAGGPAIRVLATEHRHGTVDRALRQLGLGTDSLVALPTDAASRLQPETLARALGERDAPTIVILDAADLNVGAFDPFEALIPLARAAGAWTHVDGAFGLWARASRRYRDRTRGIELAQSWATDGHKWLNTPKDIGIAVVAEPAPHRAAMGLAASYIVRAADGARDAMDFTPDWTRRARGIPVWAVLRELGREGVEAMIDRCCDFAQAITTGIGAFEGVVLPAGAPSLNQGLVRFLDPRPGATDADHDAFTLRMVAAINAEGTAFFSTGQWQGRRTMRISVVGARTRPEDVDLTVAAVGRVLAAERAALQA